MSHMILKAKSFHTASLFETKDHVYLYLLCIGASVMTAFDPVINMEHDAILGGFKCLYFLTKREQAHHTNYPALLDLAKLLGCDYFKKLKVIFL